MISIRPIREDDFKFITNSWLYSLRAGCDYFRQIPNEAYEFHYRPKIAALIARCPNSRIACLDDEPSVIVGYCIANGLIHHYLYVKPEWRRNGIANRLTSGAEYDVLIVTHLTKTMKAIIHKRPEIKFNPFTGDL